MNPILILAVAFTATIIGAIPLGLVNLTVLDVSFKNSRVAAMKIAHGASWIEILYALTAIVAGSFITSSTNNFSWVQYTFALLPAGVGIVFLIKKGQPHANTKVNAYGFLKGVFLNLISIQVLVYWIVAMTFIGNHWQFGINPETLLLFAIGVWLGKIAVLWIYARFSKSILSRSEYLANNINRFIGIVLILSGFLQFIK